MISELRSSAMIEAGLVFRPAGEDDFISAERRRREDEKK